MESAPTILRVNKAVGRMRADMESAPTIELLRLDWVGWQYAGGYGIRPYYLNYLKLLFQS